jgi:N-carbamoylputrescine amidase
MVAALIAVYLEPSMEELRLIRAAEPLESPARTRPPSREPFRIGAVQQRWHEDPEEHRAALRAGIELAAGEGAGLVCLQELTLSRYFAVDESGPQAAGAEPEELPGGPTFEFAAAAAAELDVHVHASLYERADAADGLGYNTAIVVSPAGELVARTRKLHIPITAGYYEDRYFRPGPPGKDAYPLLRLGDAGLGLPTCWDQWFPEVARAYSLEGADVLVYPTAIGSEPDHPEFDTEPLWHQVIVSHGIANGLFMVVPNRIGTEGPITFYGSSFVSDPYGRVVVQAPRDEPAVLVADLDLDQRRDWLALFPFLATRRPETYGVLTDAPKGGKERSAGRRTSDGPNSAGST